MAKTKIIVLNKDDKLYHEIMKFYELLEQLIELNNIPPPALAPVFAMFLGELAYYHKHDINTFAKLYSEQIKYFYKEIQKQKENK